jgi:heat shock protein HslJ
MMGVPEDMEAEAAFFEALEANTFERGMFLTADGVTFIRA